MNSLKAFIYMSCEWMSRSHPFVKNEVHNHLGTQDSVISKVALRIAIPVTYNERAQRR